MKRIILVVLAAASVCGCETSSTVTQAPNPVKCQVTLAIPPMMDAGGGSGSLGITTQPECAWDVSSTASWISGFTPPSGQGNGTVSFRVTANDGASIRDGMIVVNGEQARVSQRAPCRYDIGPANQNVSASGGAGSINIATTSDCSWSAASEASWIVVTSSPSGSGNGSVRFTVPVNLGDARSSAIAIANQRANITQAGATAPPPTCTVNISPTSQNVPAAGGSGISVTVTAGSTCQWSATSGATWITINAGAAGTGNGTVVFSAAPNTGELRTGTLTIGGRALTVSQAGSSSPTPPAPPPVSCSYSISPRNDSTPVLGGNGTVDVSTTSACAWTASSNASWITVTSGASGTGNGRVSYLVLANTGGSRSGTLTIAGQTFTVTQAALVCSYSIAPGNDRVEGTAGSGTVTVSTSSSCTWTATSNASWITVTSGASGTGNGTVAYSYTANPGKDRRGTITVAGRTFTIDQNERK